MSLLQKEIDGFENYVVYSDGRIRSSKAGKFMKPRMDSDGYPLVNLWSAGRKTTFKVHRLVALGFIPNPESKPQVNHINGIKYDNRVENLEWVTQSENRRHAYATGLQPRGEARSDSKLTEGNVMDIRARYSAGGISQRELGEEFGVCQGSITNIVNFKSWKHVA